MDLQKFAQTPLSIPLGATAEYLVEVGFGTNGGGEPSEDGTTITGLTINDPVPLAPSASISAAEWEFFSDPNDLTPAPSSSGVGPLNLGPFDHDVPGAPTDGSIVQIFVRHTFSGVGSSTNAAQAEADGIPVELAEDTTTIFDLTCDGADNITESTAVALVDVAGTLLAGTSAFRVEWGTVMGGPYPNQSDSVSGPLADEQVGVALTGLPDGTTIYYRVRTFSDPAGTIEYDPAIVSGECSFDTIEVVDPNEGPVIAGLDDQAGPVGDELCDDFTVTDADGTVVSVVAAPAGATLTDNGGGSWTICFTPAAEGDTTFTITATDDDGATSDDDIIFTGEAVAPEPEPGGRRRLPFDLDGCCDDDGGELSPAVRSFGVDDECLTDENGVFFRRSQADPETGVVTVSTVDIAGAAYVPVGAINPCSPAEQAAAVPVDREVVCWVDADGDLHTGTMRHDDSLPAPGWVLFDQHQTPVADTGSITFVPCSFDTAQPLTSRGEIFDVLPGSPWTQGAFTGPGAILESVTFTVIEGTATVTGENGNVVSAIPAGMSMSWTQNPNDAQLLGPDQIVAEPGSRVVVNYTTRG